MASNVVAYVGIESFDIILYLSRLLQKMDRKVLIVDYSETKALTNSVPQIPGVDTDMCSISYRRVDFTTMLLDAEIIKQYDDILIGCGFSHPKFDLTLLTRIVFVTDLFAFNMNRIGNLDLYDNLFAEKALLIREASNTKLTTEYILSKIKKNIPEELVSTLYRDEADIENSLLCHYNQVFRFTHISWVLKSYLIEETKVMCRDIKDNQVKMAYKRARKGD